VQQVAEKFAALRDLVPDDPPIRPAQVNVPHTVRADLHSRGGALGHGGLGHQWLDGTAVLPVVRLADAVGHHVHACREAVAQQRRHSVFEKVGVPVIEGQPDQSTPVARREQLTHRHAAQSAARQPVQLPVQSSWRDRDPVRVVRAVGGLRHRVVHDYVWILTHGRRPALSGTACERRR